jgi:AcrR family transcriptional regulator
MKPNTRPRTKPPEIRREEIMDAAQRLFLKQGVGSTTIDDVAAGADIAKGTIYLHFPSKQELLIALGERFAERHLAYINAAMAAKSEQDWKGKLTAWAEACIGFYLDSIALHDMLFHEARSPTRKGLADNIIIDHLESLLNAGHAAGVWSIDDARFTAVFLFSGMHGIVDDAYLQEKRLKEKRIQRGRLVERLRRLSFRTVGWPSDDDFDASGAGHRGPENQADTKR